MFKWPIIGFSVLVDLAGFSDCKSGEFTDENSSVFQSFQSFRWVIDMRL